MELIVFGAIAWFACGFVGACGSYAYFQRKYPLSAREQRTTDALFSIFWMLLGPIALAGSFISADFLKHGFAIPFTDATK